VKRQVNIRIDSTKLYKIMQALVFVNK